MRRNKHGVLPEVEERLQSLGLTGFSTKQGFNRAGLKTSDGSRKTIYGKSNFGRDNFMRDINRSNGQETDEEEQVERTRKSKIITSTDSKLLINENKTISTKQINESGHRIMITTKTRQSNGPYMRGDLRIKQNQPKSFK